VRLLPHALAAQAQDVRKPQPEVSRALSWPVFGLSEAINQTIAIVGTLVGVFLGGWFAFKLGLRQMRHERALDRRVKSLEALVGLVDSYRTWIATFNGLEREVRKGAKDRVPVRDRALSATTDAGRHVAETLRELRLYSDELPVLDTVFDKQTEAYLFTWTEVHGFTPSDEGLAYLDAICSELDAAHKTLVDILRTELALPPAKPPRRRSIRLPQNPVGPKAAT
jgi:hypothetical protein